MKELNKKKFLGRLGEWLTKLRKKKGLAQDELTEKAGLARGAMSRIENGIVDPQATTLVKIAHALDVSPGKTLEIGSKK